MKGLILSGGKGTRLRPITHTSAKQLVPVANKPVLFFAIEAMVEAGITDIGIITGDTGPEVREAVGDGSRFRATVTYIPQHAPLGLAHAVLTARDFLGAERFVMYLGDNLIRDGIVPLVEEFTRAVPDLALVGVYLFSPAVHDAIDRIEPSARGELEITDAIQRMIDDGSTVVPHVITGWWKDTGRLEDMLEANRIVLDGLAPRMEGELGENVRLEGKVIVERGAVLRNCRVRGPAIIGERTVVENAYIGPFTAIYYDCVVRNAEIEHSIVLERSRIENVEGKIESSLLGKDCVVCESPERPRALRLMLGDHSRVELH
jgi:glucose-1-phosphate thymidylyltransferase